MFPVRPCVRIVHRHVCQGHQRIDMMTTASSMGPLPDALSGMVSDETVDQKFEQPVIFACVAIFCPLYFLIADYAHTSLPALSYSTERASTGVLSTI